MRTIKFRGKTLDGGEWVCGWLIGQPFSLTFNDTSESYSIVQYNVSYRVDPETIGQYTGLKDKNGKEIYEGDIMRYVFLDKHKGSFVTEVKWDTKATGFFAKGTDRTFGLDFCNGDSVKGEVIGNIYENPELLAKNIK